MYSNSSNQELEVQFETKEIVYRYDIIHSINESATITETSSIQTTFINQAFLSILEDTKRDNANLRLNLSFSYGNPGTTWKYELVKLLSNRAETGGYVGVGSGARDKGPLMLSPRYIVTRRWDCYVRLSSGSRR